MTLTVSFYHWLVEEQLITKEGNGEMKKFIPGDMLEDDNDDDKRHLTGRFVL